MPCRTCDILAIFKCEPLLLYKDEKMWVSGMLGNPQLLGTEHVSSLLFPFLKGVPSDFIVNTVNAGTGALSVTIDGPSKVKMDCQECPEGYKVTYTPMAPGSYLISIKYGGPQHIVGSPFKAKVSGKTLCCYITLSYFKTDLLYV